MNDIVWAADGGDAAVAAHVAKVIDRPEPTLLGLSGGSTPRAILERLAAMDLPWPRVEILPIDDRLVPHDHPASNFGMLRKALGGTGATLRALEPGMAVRRFDLVWMGMGEDGHVASIFPNVLDALPTAPAALRTRPDPLPPEAPFERVTLTLDALADTDDMIFVIRGSRKRALMEQAIDRRSDLPVARLLARRQGPITIYWTQT